MLTFIYQLLDRLCQSDYTLPAGLVMVEVGTDDQDGKKEKVPRSKRDKKHALKQGIAKAELEVSYRYVNFSHVSFYKDILL